MCENTLFSLLGCFVLSGLFVGSLYIWPSKNGRNHPTTIKQRFLSVFFVVILSPLILKIFISPKKFNKHSLFELLGFRLAGFIPAALFPLALTIVLFIGPLCMHDYRGLKKCFLNIKHWVINLPNLIWLRNIIIGPLSEEFIFRACMMPLLMQCFDSLTSIFFCSFFFGLAHLHHVIERYQVGETTKMLISRAFIQFSYTALFGAYSAFIFLKTGHFVAPFLVHAFCNIMAFPDFPKIFTYDNPKKSVLLGLFVLGVIFWYVLLEPLTNHKLYQNDIYFSSSVIINS